MPDDDSLIQVMQTTVADYTDMPESRPPLNVGIELEWPMSTEPDTTMIKPAKKSRGLYDRINDDPDYPGSDLRAGGNVTTDPSVGTELVSGPRPGSRGGISPERAREWYQEAFDIAQSHNYAHEPTGMLNENNYTAGLHIHISEWDEEKARRLYDVSTQNWMHIFACSTITETPGSADVGVFRGNRYCKSTFDRERYSVVHSVDATAGHYEWRLPEPMGLEHFDLLMEFLERFHTDEVEAVEWAQDLVMDADERLTAIKRASNLSDHIFDPPEVENTRVFRHPLPETREFYQRVRNHSSMPYIYRVDVNGEPYYAFHSNDTGIGSLTDVFDSSEMFDVGGFGQFPRNGVVHARDLEPTDSTEIHQTVQDAMEVSLTQGESIDITERDPTDMLREVHPDLQAPTEA